ncbi:glycosyltransferase [Roseovarius tibetensis]|uniref:glycosyltransferase n=1 Tax=Roseovarius tibetensis TaxID=2685897 RepID=UPI003D7F1A1A
MTGTLDHFEYETSPELSVIIVSYNTSTLTLRAVGAVLDQKGPVLEVIVVDNASSDGSAKALAQTWPQVQLIALQHNLGFARACNQVTKGDHSPQLCKARYLRLAAFRPERSIGQSALQPLAAVSSIVRFRRMIGAVR